MAQVIILKVYLLSICTYINTYIFQKIFRLLNIKIKCLHNLKSSHNNIFGIKFRIYNYVKKYIQKR